MDNSGAIYKFEEFENRIERMEAEAGLVNYGTKETIEQELDAIIVDEDIENELHRIKSSLAEKPQEATQA